MAETLTTTLPNYHVGDTEYFVIVFPYPQHGEIDFEVWSKDKEEYLFTITSNRPELSTSVLWAYMKGLPTDAVVYSTKESNV